MKKLGFQLGLKDTDVSAFDTAQQVLLCQASFPLLKTAECQLLHDPWLLNNKEQLAAITASRLDSQLMCDYYGAEVTSYFDWLTHYTKSLLAPSFAGGLLFLFEYISPSDYAGWEWILLPVFCCLLCA